MTLQPENVLLTAFPLLRFTLCNAGKCSDFDGITEVQSSLPDENERYFKNTTLKSFHTRGVQ